MNSLALVTTAFSRAPRALALRSAFVFVASHAVFEVATASLTIFVHSAWESASSEPSDSSSVCALQPMRAVRTSVAASAIPAPVRARYMEDTPLSRFAYMYADEVPAGGSDGSRARRRLSGAEGRIECVETRGSVYRIRGIPGQRSALYAADAC